MGLPGLFKNVVEFFMDNMHILYFLGNTRAGRVVTPSELALDNALAITKMTFSFFTAHAFTRSTDLSPLINVHNNNYTY